MHVLKGKVLHLKGEQRTTAGFQREMAKKSIFRFFGFLKGKVTVVTGGRG